MPTIAVFGATGTLGRRVVARLTSSLELVLVGRDAATLTEVARTAQGPTSTRIVDLDVDGGISGALSGVDLAISALPVPGGAAGRVLEAAVAGAVHLIDTADAQPHLQRAYDGFDSRARDRGTVVVPGVGWRTAIGDLLTSVAAARTDQPRQVHVAAVVPDRGGVLGAASPGVLRGITASLGVPATV
ncbi:MAG: saccharopine dehydrogenase NADP-binding domain-containing protein, partial [Nitriliruptor sp.]